MAKPQWKVVQEEKERVIKEREEAEKKAKQEKLATLGGAPSDVAEHSPTPAAPASETVPELGLVDKEEAIDHENRRLARHMAASDAKASKKSDAQVQKEQEEAKVKAEEQARSDALIAKMQQKMAQHQATSHHTAPASGGGLVEEVVEEEYDEEARKRQAVMNIGKFIGK